MKQIKILLLFLFIINTSLYANNDVYLLPKENKEIKNKILSLIENSKSSIKISMYNFSYKKFAKALIKASKKDLKIKVILDKSKVEKENKIFKLLKKNNIKVVLSKKKLHTKIAIFDGQIALIGSTNWTKQSFKDNYEIVLLTKDKKVIKKLDNFIEKF